MLHGWGMNSSAWDLVAPSLESQYQVSWVDLPGHGENRDIIADSLEDIVDLIVPYIPQQAHLMGWSLGGLIVQALAKRVPERIKTLTLVSSTPRFSQAKDWPHAMPTILLDKFHQQLSSDLEGTLKRFIALQFMGVANSKEIQRKLMQNTLKSLKMIKSGGGVNDNHTMYKALALGLAILSTADYRYHEDALPQHWLLAENDRLIPKEVINDLKSLRPNAQITLLKQSGHAPFMTHPTDFLNSVTAFINHA